MTKPCNIAILGSTGSIGVNTLKVVDQHPDLFKVIALTACNNFKLLEHQIKKYKPSHVAIGTAGLDYFKKKSYSNVSFHPLDECTKIASLKEIDRVVLAMSGTSALMPFLAALKSGKTVMPANKEALVIAGDLIMQEAKRSGAQIIPIDSEQSAIFQCLEGQRSKVLRVHLTASGGPLRTVKSKYFKYMKPKDILHHPRWQMGNKITVDSATMMNKGFEVLEAKHLFGLTHDQIKVLVHPEAIIHSLVEFDDGSLLAQLGITDMRLPIQYALSYPKRIPTGLPCLNLAQIGSLHFEAPDLKKFPSLELAFLAARVSGTLPAVLNAADEIAVEAFLNQRINFISIYKVVEKVVLRHTIVQKPCLADILSADQWARSEAESIIASIKKLKHS